MFWGDLLLDQDRPAGEARRALSVAFSVAGESVAIVNDVAEAQLGAGVRLVSEIGPGGGDFPLRLSIYLLDAMPGNPDPTSIAKRLCAAMKCSCLLSDAAANPYSMSLVTRTGEVRQVFLDPEHLDEGEFVLAHLV